ncbi:cytidylyltransferase domain-containing protein [Nitrospina sp. 32_T5]|uniref:cytidylyltransferase domain-containing protein n=1 Tax=unclassified Nitrospina TaxID=2638683 RepID=UPI003F9C1727
MTPAAIVYAPNRPETDPGHALNPLEGIPMVQHVLQRLRNSSRVDRIVLLADEDAPTERLAQVAEAMGVGFTMTASPSSPRSWIQAAEELGADQVVPVGANLPLFDAELLDALLKEHQKSRADYTTTSDYVPPGTTAPVIRLEVCRTLSETNRSIADPASLMAALEDPAHGLQAATTRAPWYLRNVNVRLVVETPKDHELLGMLYGKYLNDSGIVALDEVIYFLSQNPGIAGYNLT